MNMKNQVAIALIAAMIVKFAGKAVDDYWDSLSTRGKATFMTVVLAIVLVYFGPAIGRVVRTAK